MILFKNPIYFSYDLLYDLMFHEHQKKDTGFFIGEVDWIYF